jgi:hypothetical protein
MTDFIGTKIIIDSIKSIIKKQIEDIAEDNLEILFPGITLDADKLQQKSCIGLIYASIDSICADNIKRITDELFAGLEQEKQEGSVRSDEVEEAFQLAKNSIANKINGQGGDA